MPQAFDTIDVATVPGSRIATTPIVVDSPTLTAETVVASITAPVVAGRVYAIVFDVAYHVDADGTAVRTQIREDGIGGNRIQARDTPGINNAQSVLATRVYVEYTATVTENKVFVATASQDSGTGNINVEASGGFPSYLFVDYIRG